MRGGRARGFGRGGPGGRTRRVSDAGGGSSMIEVMRAAARSVRPIEGYLCVWRRDGVVGGNPALGEGEDLHGRRREGANGRRRWRERR